ncbi:BA14K family protein [Labrenzia sp. VG12]|uniref:BA14K family protein n=1 Tax=Labrenzia sp. VG12 TaxID=2021862 RepID=UPI001FFCCEA5|nr:BA14K family protein [Labrenzia sp. VG12]
MFNKAFSAAMICGCLALAFTMPVEALPAPKGNLTTTLAKHLPLVKIDQRSGFTSGQAPQRRPQHYLGYRGYPKYRYGYRRYNGWWYPPAAFAFGFNVVPPPYVVVRPPLYLPPPRYAPHLSPVHYQWCDERYRSYRAADNSFQPYKGPRRACLSPYGP